jgi:hypothetical protein
LFIVANHCFSLVYLQCPKVSKDLGENCDGDEDCCNRDDPTDASLFDKECTQFTCQVGTQKIALLQEEIAAVDAALVLEGCPYWSVSGTNSNCESTFDGKCIQSHDSFDGSTKYASSVDCTFRALGASQATLTYGGIENCSNPACACDYLQIG